LSENIKNNPFLNQSAIFFGFIVGILNVFPYTPPVHPLRRREIIFDLEREKGNR